ncbi:MAG TPA: ABC transporter substrate-binding protein [Polyangiaceae bacterium]|nr:ABC transporter substrate-binding protein [Polyangiaceae bacterium]
MRRVLVSALFSAAVALASLSAPSLAYAGPPTDVVKAKQTELFKLLEKAPDPSNQKRISTIFDEMLDYGGLAESSLGSEWKSLKESERAEFTGLLKQLVQKSYERNLKKILAYDVGYVSEEAAGDKAWVVKTKAKNKSDAHEDPIEIDFKLVEKAGGKFMVADIVTEDVSLVDSYRSQFVKIIKKDGYPALAAKMKEKIAKSE